MSGPSGSEAVGRALAVTKTSLNCATRALTPRPKRRGFRGRPRLPCATLTLSAKPELRVSTLEELAMSRRAVRRGQLIAPFGPGAMVVARDGTSLIVGGLDHWFERESGDTAGIDKSEFKIQEWRLERRLGVESFYLPPDIRRKRRDFWLEEQPNTGLTIPALRFPRWHVCTRCQSLQEFPPVRRERPLCALCQQQDGRPSRRRVTAPMVQVRFIAICEAGHIQDFPWREWVHQAVRPTCSLGMKLVATGGASLAATKVTCSCGASRSLEHITEADAPGGSGDDAGDGGAGEPSTYLTDNLAPGFRYMCQGLRPWLGEEYGVGCGRPIRGSLRGATNVHYSKTPSAIYLPRASDEAPQELVEILESAQLAGLLALLRIAGQPATPAVLRTQHPALLNRFSDRQISAALAVVGSDFIGEQVPTVMVDDEETRFRRAEYVTLRTAHTENQLVSRSVSPSLYDEDIGRYFARVTLIEKLRETRVLAGFTRVYPESSYNIEELKAALWRDPPQAPNRWLPAQIVYGEGVYLELNSELVRAWEGRTSVITRVDPLNGRYRVAQERRSLEVRFVTPRLVLAHTFAHLLMNQLTFECGYGSASLRERLFVSTAEGAEMAGLLVYTAAGDSEGTLGGLVRMGKPGNLEQVIRRALARARWCSADPVCMELGASGGQGPDSCNLAACHNCGLAPETSCEEFNRFLDRGLVVGALNQRDLGFFADLGPT